MGILVVIILFAVGLVLLLDCDCDFGCFGGIFGIILIAVGLAICKSGITSIEDIKAKEKIILSNEITSTYELVPLDFAIYEKDPESSEKNVSSYLHINNEGDFTFCYKTMQDGVEGFAPETIYSNNVFFPEAYIGNPKIVEITTIYKYHLSGFKRIWLFGLGMSKEKTSIKYEIYIPENPTFKYEQ